MRFQNAKQDVQFILSWFSEVLSRPSGHPAPCDFGFLKLPDLDSSKNPSVVKE
jgi:hypothetical protein